MPFPPRSARPGYLDINPLGAVPTLTDGDLTMTDPPPSTVSGRSALVSLAPAQRRGGPGGPRISVRRPVHGRRHHRSPRPVPRPDSRAGTGIQTQLRPLSGPALGASGFPARDGAAG